jgi:hypothetical protein
VAIAFITNPSNYPSLFLIYRPQDEGEEGVIEEEFKIQAGINYPTGKLVRACNTVNGHD